MTVGVDPDPFTIFILTAKSKLSAAVAACPLRLLLPEVSGKAALLRGSSLAWDAIP